MFVNDTVRLGDFTVTPGIRYDHLSNSENMVSPSLGLTWRFADHSFFRAQVSRGFKKVYLVDVSENEDLEKVTSYQAGIETSALPFMNVKATLFQYDGSDVGRVHNSKEKRYGYELEVVTRPIFHFSITAGFTYLYTDYYGNKENDDQYSGKLTLLYDNPDLFSVELFGQYLHWDQERTFLEYYDRTMIWDLNATKTVQLSDHTYMDVFLSVHNIFDGRHNWTEELYPNPSRWVEGGLRFYF